MDVCIIGHSSWQRWRSHGNKGQLNESSRPPLPSEICLRLVWQSGNIKTAPTYQTLKTMSNTEEMYQFAILIFSFPVMISAWKSFILPSRIAVELEGFLSSVRCMLGENDCVNHQTCGGRSRLMLLRLQDVARIQLVKSEVLWDNWATHSWQSDRKSCD